MLCVKKNVVIAGIEQYRVCRTVCSVKWCGMCRGKCDAVLPVQNIVQGVMWCSVMRCVVCAVDYGTLFGVSLSVVSAAGACGVMRCAVQGLVVWFREDVLQRRVCRCGCNVGGVECSEDVAQWGWGTVRVWDLQPPEQWCDTLSQQGYNRCIVLSGTEVRSPRV